MQPGSLHIDAVHMHMTGPAGIPSDPLGGPLQRLPHGAFSPPAGQGRMPNIRGRDSHVEQTQIVSRANAETMALMGMRRGANRLHHEGAAVWSAADSVAPAKRSMLS